MEIVATLEALRLDPSNPSQAVTTRTVFMKEGSVSKYRPKRVNSYGLDGVPYIDRVLEGTVGTSYELLKELHSNRDQLSNISYVDMIGKDIKNFSRNMLPWLKEDLLVPIKTKEQFQDINLAGKVSGINIDVVPEKGKRYFLFNPSLLLPYSRTDKGQHFDTLYLIYQYLKSYRTPAQIEYYKIRKIYNDALLTEYFRDPDQCSFDEFLKRSREYIKLCAKECVPELYGWFKTKT